VLFRSDVFHIGNVNSVTSTHYTKHSISPFFNSLWFLSFFNQIRPQCYDVIILNDASAAFFSGLFFSKKSLSKCIYLLHGSEPEFIYEKPNLKYRIINFKRFHSRCVKYCGRIVAPSLFMRNKYLSRVKPIINDDKIIVLYFGVDESIFFNKPVITFDAEGRTTLLTVSRLVKKKGFLNMLRIFKKALQKDNSLRWLIIGRGPFEVEFKREITQLGLEPYIELIGHVPREELNDYYSKASVFWLLSDFDESFGLVYIEANMCGLPTIGNKRAGVIEAINDGHSGFLVANDSQCLDIINHKKWKVLSQERIIKSSLKFSSKEFSKKLLIIINSIHKELG